MINFNKLTENAIKVLNKRYLKKDENGNVIETPQDMFRRVAQAVAIPEVYYSGIDRMEFIAEEFFNMMNNLEFLPNSPTLMNAGRPLGQLSACFVLPIENDIKQILQTVKNTAIIHKSGGGTGFNFSKVKLPPILPKNYKPIFLLSDNHPDHKLLKETDFSHADPNVISTEFLIKDFYKDHFDHELKIIYIEDNMESIFNLEVLLDMPDIIVFSKVRPAKSRVSTTGGEASGPVSFMRVWNEAVKFLTNDINPITTIKLFNMCTDVVKQGGTRRGANMGIVNIDCEFIEDFIDCKQDNTEITNFNLSVGIVGDFWEKYLEAKKDIEEGKGADITYNIKDYATGEILYQVNSIYIMNKIITGAWRNGEPGIIFLDKINKYNPILTEQVESTNPCGEQPLLPYESCNLGSINLVAMATKNELGKWELNKNKLLKTIRRAVRFLDNVIEINKFPIKEIEVNTKRYRKIGLGVMGWAQLLYLMEIPYDSQEALDLAEEISKFIMIESHKVSEELGKERGEFPAIVGSIYEGTHMRNATTTTIAPTGTLSIIASVSSGIEPEFALVYVRNSAEEELPYVNRIFDEALRNEIGNNDEEYKRIINEVIKKGTVKGVEGMPEKLQKVFVTAQDISVEAHVKMQAAWQKNVDNAVSKTINMAYEATKEDVAKAYILARETGCKGITIYRDGSRENQVLNVGMKTEKKSEDKKDTTFIANNKKTEEKNDTVIIPERIEIPKLGPKHIGTVHPKPRPRPEITTGFTQKVKIGCGNLYVTVNYDKDGICEVFTNTGRTGGCPSQSEATARLVSLALRSGIEVTAIIDQLKGIRCPSTIRQQGLNVLSCPDAIGRLIERVYKGEIKIPVLDVADEDKGSNEDIYTCTHNCSSCTMYESCNNPVEKRNYIPTSGETHQCPECGKPVEHEGGCVICRYCGWGKCG